MNEMIELEYSHTFSTPANSACGHTDETSSAISASHVSPRLCGGIDVAIPTAMPCAPLRRRKGSLAGSTVGSRSEPSKLSAKSTVSIATSASSAGGTPPL